MKDGFAMASPRRLGPAILALVSGSLLALAFAPIAFSWLAIFSPACLLFLWRDASPKQAFLLGLLFGIGFFAVGMSWIFISIHIYGQASFLLSLAITALFVICLALFIALAGYLLNRCFPKPTTLKSYLLFPSFWALSEWLRSWALTGCPWLLLGTSQVDSPLRGYAPIVGIFGLAFLITVCSALLLDLLDPLFRRYFPSAHTSLLPPCLKPKRRLGALFMLLLIYLLGQGLSVIHWTTPLGPPVSVSLVQANIPQTIKWDPHSLMVSLDSYQQLTESHWHSRLIIWPEAAVPLLQEQAQSWLLSFDKKAKRANNTLILGIPIKKEGRYYNGMIALGVDQATYYKRRLVIFGEYLPWWIQWARGLLAFLDIPMSSFSAGPVQPAPFRVAGFDLGTFICYEIAYPSLVRRALPQAELLLTINDDAWFGHSFALGQHLQIGRFQALATGRSLLFLSNTGLTAIVTPQGAIQSELPPFEVAVLTDHVYRSVGSTPWVQWGDCPILLFLVGLVLLCYAYLQYNERTRDVPR
jgi:apolipoprotein N-acyltransferase